MMQLKLYVLAGQNALNIMKEQASTASLLP
jgi:hypothetical protein